jgi:hypothetical protein
VHRTSHAVADASANGLADAEPDGGSNKRADAQPNGSADECADTKSAAMLRGIRSEFLGV